ncbi:hypothetical protein IWW38_005213, partial [Coemansia aciculifera]
CGGKNPGYSYFQAKVLTKLGRLDQALERYIDYLEQRGLDGLIWELVGELLVSIGDSKRYGGDSEEASWLRLALGAFFVSHMAISNSRGWKTSELAVKRKQLQTEQLLKHVTETLCKLSTTAAAKSECEDKIWELCKVESALDESSQLRLLQSCENPLATSVKWVIAHNWRGSLDDADCEEDDEKNAADL